MSHTKLSSPIIPMKNINNTYHFPLKTLPGTRRIIRDGHEHFISVETKTPVQPQPVIYYFLEAGSSSSS